MDTLKKILFLFVYLTFSNIAFSQNFTSKIDKLLSKTYTEESPGISILISKNGEKIYNKSFGNADLKSHSLISNNTIFQIGSITKQFTAVAILLLEEQGKLKLSDNIKKYLPDYPLKGNHVTIHNLLNHTSGIRGKTPISDPKLRTKNLTIDETINFFKDFPIKFKAGEKFSYTNSGYILLGKIIEVISGTSYQKFIKNNIFNKLSMDNTSFGNSDKKTENKAIGYQFINNEYLKAPYISIYTQHSAGSILSTVDDLLKWQNALNSNAIIKKTTYNKATNGSFLKNGQHIPYGYGWYKRKINNSIALVHGGATPGFMSNGIYLKSENIYIVALTNCFCKKNKNLQKITYKIAKLFTDKKSLSNKLKLTNNELKKWTGKYKLNNNMILTFKIIKGYLYVSNNKKPDLKHKLISISKNEFSFENKKFNFLFSNIKKDSKNVKMSSGNKTLNGTLISND